MKRKDGGYVLIYAVVIIAILSIVSVSICAAAVSNYSSQKRQVERMQERLEAEGQLERLLASLDGLEFSQIVENVPYQSDENAEMQFAAEMYSFDPAELTEKLQGYVGSEVTVVPVENEKTLLITVPYADAQIITAYGYDLTDPVIVPPENREEGHPMQYTFTRTVSVTNCLSYEIVSAEGGDAE